MDRALAALALLMAGPAWAQENVALGASYTLDPAPNYAHSTDDGDGVQLTDGVYTEGYFWTQLSTVGWQEKKPVIVTIDLGAAGRETHWLSGIDRTLADRARIQVVEALTGLTALTAVTQPDARPHGFRLEQNYPNPFNPDTVIEFSVPTAGEVDLAIYNLAGQRARSLLGAVLDAGKHSVTWDGRDDLGRELASGVYPCRLRAETRVDTRKLLLLK